MGTKNSKCKSLLLCEDRISNAEYTESSDRVVLHNKLVGTQK
jgi:hypothetical protein